MPARLEVISIEVDEAIAATVANLNDFSEPMAAFAIARHGRLIGDQFESESDPYDDKWTPLTAAYAKYKAQSSRLKTEILQATGDMRSKATFDSDRNSATWGFNSKIAEYHQFGTKKMPARPLIENESQGLAEQDAELIEELLTDWVSGAWNQ
jgi:phage gpG-like protein